MTTKEATTKEAISLIERIIDDAGLYGNPTFTKDAEAALLMAIKALEKQMHLERNLYNDVYMKGYYPTDKPEELSDYHLFVPYKVVEQFIRGEE